MKDKKRREYIDPAKSQEHKEKGNEKFKAGDWPGAIAEYSEAIKRNPDDGKLFRYRQHQHRFTSIHDFNSNRAACYTKLAELPHALKVRV